MLRYREFLQIQPIPANSGQPCNFGMYVISIHICHLSADTSRRHTTICGETTRNAAEFRHGSMSTGPDQHCSREVQKNAAATGCLPELTPCDHKDIWLPGRFADKLGCKQRAPVWRMCPVLWVVCHAVCKKDINPEHSAAGIQQHKGKTA